MNKKPDFNPADLPQDVQKLKEHYQYPQPADSGKALKKIMKNLYTKKQTKQAKKKD